ncbi:MAG: YitT family protein, partial [Oscillospiraceae bacterium]|nr:YitT family protein [Oscillospiraceae bacterium]
GSFLVAAALSMFTVPNDIAPGGITGLATALAQILPVKISVLTFILNVPLLLWAWKDLGIKSVSMTIVSTALLSVFIELTDRILPAYTNNELLASVAGGALSGLGVGILFLRGISTGGTDLIALLLKKLFPNGALGTLLLIVDATVVLIAVFIFKEIEVALYSTISIYVSSKVIDALGQGVDYAKVIYIVTDKGDEISKVLNTYTDRGTTAIAARGGYTGDSKQLIISVTRRNVLAQTLRLIKQTDPSAFTYVTDSTEVHGEGFKPD